MAIQMYLDFFVKSGEILLKFSVEKSQINEYIEIKVVSCKKELK